MFKRVQHPFFRPSRVFTLILLSLCLASVGQAFQLDSESLVQRTDYFSKLKQEKKYNSLRELIVYCKERRSSRCIPAAQTVYIDPHFVFFRNLVASLAVNYATKEKKTISKLSFLNKDELKRREIYRILKSYEPKDVEGFFGENVFMKTPQMKEIFVDNVSLFCKYSQNKKFIDLALTSLVASDDLYEKNFSKFPCSLDLSGRMDLLVSEIKKSKKNKSYKYDYYFKFLRDRVSKKVQRGFPTYRKKKMAYRKKKVWYGIFGYKPYIQERLTRNLFFKGEYELLSHGASFPESKLKTLSREALEHVVKSLVIEGEYEKALRVSKHVEAKKDEAVEEILLMRGNSFLRLGKNIEAEKTYKSLLANVVDLKLSALYWLRTSLRNQNKIEEAKTVEDQILKDYPFSYYGLLVAKEQRGEGFFDIYKKKAFIKQSFGGQLTPGEIERLKFYYSYGFTGFFKKAYKSLELRLNPKQRALFSLVFKNLGDQLEVIRSLNLIWDLEPLVRKEPFLSASFPQPFQKDLEAAVKNTTYVNKAVAYAVMRQESAFGPVAKSSSGARGLMQLLPSTAKDLSQKIRYRKYRKPKDLYKPKINIYLGSKYMNRLANASKGYLPYAFASYNAGPGRMYKWGVRRSEITDLRQGLKKETYNPIDELWIEELPWSETRFYTKALLRNMGIYLAVEGKQNEFNCSPYWVCHGEKL